MAVDIFHTQITSAGMEVKDLVLKLRVNTPSVPAAWARLRSEQWTNIVRGGDEIRVGGSGEEAGEFKIRPIVTLKLNAPSENQYATILLPTTYEVSDL